MKAVEALFEGRSYVYGSKHYKNINQLYNAIKEDERQMKKETEFENLVETMSKILGVANRTDPQEITLVADKLAEVRKGLSQDEMKKFAEIIYYMKAGGSNFDMNEIEFVVEKLKERDVAVVL
jgi:hypothetical protein